MGNLPNINCQYYDRRGGCLFPKTKDDSCCRISLGLYNHEKCKNQLNYVRPPPPPPPPPKKY